MNDVRFGSAVRMARIRRGWRQEDVADRAGVSRGTVGRIECGRAAALTLAVTRRVCVALEIDLELQPRGRGSDLDRLVNARHSALHETVARHVATDFADWVLVSEVSFNIWGERGVIDLLLWHPGRRALLIIELKSELVDPGDLLSTMHRRRRLARQIAAEQGWDPATVSVWVIVSRSRTNERRLRQFRTMLRTAFPDDGRRMRGWLRDPVGSVAGCSLWDRDLETSARAPVQRVSRRAGGR
jgi:transcriptional regulator with XRE-family HTH domain